MIFAGTVICIDYIVLAIQFHKPAMFWAAQFDIATPVDEFIAIDTQALHEILFVLDCFVLVVVHQLKI